MTTKSQVIVIAGSTGIGKTALSLKLADYYKQHHNQQIEVISADSVQLYRRLDIGSNKVSKEARQRVPHHLIDCVDLQRSVIGGTGHWDVSLWYDAAHSAIQQILQRGNLPVVVGGAGLYLRWMVYGKAPTPAGTAETRSAAATTVQAAEQEAAHDSDADLVKVLAKQLQLTDADAIAYLTSVHTQAAEKLFQRAAIEEIEVSGNPCYPVHYRHSATGDYSRCLDLMTKIFDKSVHCESSCSFNGVYQPQLDRENQQFIAIENFYYTLSFFNGVDNELTTDNNKVVAALKTKGSAYCSQDWNDIKTQYSTQAATELGYYCFAAAYEAKVLEHGFGFTPDTHLTAIRQIGDKVIDWALGAVLVQVIQQHSTGGMSVSGADNEAHESEVNLIKQNEQIADGTLQDALVEATCQNCYTWMIVTSVFAALFLYMWRYTFYRLANKLLGRASASSGMQRSTSMNGNRGFTNGYSNGNGNKNTRYNVLNQV